MGHCSLSLLLGAWGVQSRREQEFADVQVIMEKSGKGDPLPCGEQ